MAKKLSKGEWRKYNKQMDAEQVDLMWKESYNSQAGKYDEVRFYDDKGIFYKSLVDRILQEEITAFIKPSNDTKILDVATGTGRGAIALAKMGFNVTGVDLSEEMLKKARQKSKEERLENVNFELANARYLPFEDKSFDVIISLKFFHLMPNHVRRPIIEEMIRVVKPEGILLLEFANPFYGFFIEAYRRWLTGKNATYIWPSQTKALFAGTKVLKKRGTYLPFSGKICKFNHYVGRSILSLCRYFPFKHLSSEIYYICRRKDK